MLVHGCSVPELDQRAMESLQREDGKRARFWNGELRGEWPARFKANHRAVTKLAMHNGGWRQHCRLKEAAAAYSTMWWRTEHFATDGRSTMHTGLAIQLDEFHWKLWQEEQKWATALILIACKFTTPSMASLCWSCLEPDFTCNGC